MSLLRDIQTAAIDSNTNITDLLRKCKVLAVRLRSKEFETWVDHELNGYNDKKDLPKYRILDIQAYGYFAGAFNSAIPNGAIPPAVLPDNIEGACRETLRLRFHQRCCRSCKIGKRSTQGGLARRHAANNPKRSLPSLHLPASLAGHYARSIYRNRRNCTQ